MKQIHTKHIKTGRNRRGNTLLLAILMTLLLFIIGITFLSTAITDKTSSLTTGYQMELDNGVDVVVDKIGDVLVQDLFGSGLNKNLLDGTSGNEPYDYPGPPDRWLASSEPEIFPDLVAGGVYYGWRQYSDLWGTFNYSIVDTTGDTFPDYNKQIDGLAFRHDPPLINRSGFADPLPRYWDMSNTASWRYRVEGYLPLPCDIIDPGQEILGTLLNASWRPAEANWPPYTPFPTNRHNGMRADADGDGVADSRWVRVNRMGPDGKYLWAAVRIVDNGSMLNLNTAFRNPDPAIVTNGSPQWDGTQLSHINLGGIVKGLDLLENLQGARYNFVNFPADMPDITDYANDTLYETAVSLRILNPDLTISLNGFYTPFDITDELELRNRFFLFNEGVKSRFAMVWPVTLNPQGGYGRFRPYFDFADLVFWFDKASATNDLEYYSHRHFCTTYNFDRVLAPKGASPGLFGSNWTGWSGGGKFGEFAPICINDINSSTAAVKPSEKQVAAAMILGLDHDGQLAYCPGYEDWYNEFSKSSGDYPFSWNEADFRKYTGAMLGACLYDYVDTDHNITDLTTTDPNRYFGFESEGPQVTITRLGISKFDPGPTLEDGDVETHYAVVLGNHSATRSADTIGWKLIVVRTGVDKEYRLPSLTIDSDDVVAVIDQDFGATPPQEGFYVGLFSTAGEFLDNGFELEDGDLLVLLDENGCPLDKVKVDVDSDLDDGAQPVGDITQVDALFVWNTEDRVTDSQIGTLDTITKNVIRVWDENLNDWDGPIEDDASDLEEISPWTGATVVNISLQNRLRVKTQNDNLANIGEISNIIGVGAMVYEHNDNDTYYITNADLWKIYLDAHGNDIPNENIELGRIDLGQGCFQGLTQYFTVFNPFSDSVDNDGDGLSDNPAIDGLDNDGDGLIDGADPDETFNDIGSNTEVAIAGRININTAPWFVIAQLPWINPELAQAIVAYRDVTWDIGGVVNYGPRITGDPDLVDWNTWIGLEPYNFEKPRKFSMGYDSADPDINEMPGFRNSAELLNVTHLVNDTDTPPLPATGYAALYDIRQYGRDEDTGTPLNNNDIGDGDPGPVYDEDEVVNDLRERDIIFQRISNLVTVRSDVFTAYILVRLGRDGPQKRMIAIFDRSNVFDGNQRPQLVALHPVPDPR